MNKLNLRFDGYRWDASNYLICKGVMLNSALIKPTHNLIHGRIGIYALELQSSFDWLI